MVLVRMSRINRDALPKRSAADGLAFRDGPKRQSVRARHPRRQLLRDADFKSRR